MPDDSKKEIVKKKLNRLRAIGSAIANLSRESKGLRKEVAEIVSKNSDFTKFAEEVNEDNPIQFIHGSTVISVIKSKLEKDFKVIEEEIEEDFTVIHKDLESI